MSKYTPSPPYTEEEFADMIKCYLDSEKNLELTQMSYVNRYPGRRKPKIYTLVKVVEKYQKTLQSNDRANPNVEVANLNSTKDDRILKYFMNNSHATVKKAASIFNIHTSYIEKLVEERKAEIEAQRNDEIIRKEQSLNYDNIESKRKRKKTTKKKKQDQSDSEDEINIKIEVEHSIHENKSIEASSSVTTKSEIVDDVICSETCKKETDDDVICCETQSTLKRKRKYTKRSGKKKQKSSETKRKNDPISILDTPQLHNPMVYTTRLEEMNILHEDLKHINRALVINKILWESKPKYTANQVNTNVRKAMNYSLLKNIILENLRKRETLIDLTENIDTATDDNPIVTGHINPRSNYMFKVKEEVIIDISEKINNIIIINNLFSNTRDIYVTDPKGNIIEYCSTKLSDTKKYINQSKSRLTMDMCCWFHRQHRIESIWPRHAYPFSRFLTTKHKCPPGQCTCCCKPQEKQSTEVIFNKSYNTNVFTDNLNRTDFDEKSKNLILTALRYKKVQANKNNNYTCSYSKSWPAQRFLFTEKIRKSNYQTTRNEYCEITRNSKTLRFHVDTHRALSQDGLRCVCCMNLNWKSKVPHNMAFVCCQWKRDCFLNAAYKKCNISSSTLRFLKRTLSLYMCEECKDEFNCNINKSENFHIDVPTIEHTRTLVKPTLLKIGFKATKPIAFDSQQYLKVKNIASQIVQGMKSVSNIPSAMEAPTRSTVKINVRCEQIPNLEFDIGSMDKRVAMEIVSKFKHMSLLVKEDRKVIASFNSSIQTTSTDEFQVFAQILQKVQNHILILEPILPGLVINLIMKIDDEHQSGCETFKNVNQVVDEANDNKHARDKLPTKQPNKCSESSSKQTSYKNKNDVNISNKNNSNSLINVRIKRFAHLSSGQTQNNFNNIVDSGEISIDTNKLKAYDRFASLISFSKKYNADSFKSYLHATYPKQDVDEKDMSVPKITSVYSLQNSWPTNESFPLHQTANTLNNIGTQISIPSTSYNHNINNQNNLNAYPLLIGPINQPILVYDPTAKLADLLKTPNAITSQFGMPVTASLNNSLNNNKDMVLTEPGKGELMPGFTVLTPISINAIPVPYRLIESKSQLPDIINDIPKNINVMDGTNHLVAKEEADDIVKEEDPDEVVVLDSD